MTSRKSSGDMHEALLLLLEADDLLTEGYDLDRIAQAGSETVAGWAAQARELLRKYNAEKRFVAQTNRR